MQEDPAVESVVGFTGGRSTNAGFLYSSLKPFAERKVTADEVVTRLRPKLAQVAGARLFMVAVSDLRTGGRQSNATYQYTLLSDDTAELYAWAPKLTQALMASEIVKDVNSDQQMGGLQTNVTIDRDTAMRLGLTLSAIDNTLYDAFGQRQVSTIYNPLNQYHVVMEVAPRYWQDPRTLEQIYVSTSGANPTGVQQTGHRRRRLRLLDRDGEHGGVDRGRFGAQPRHQRARRRAATRPLRPARRSRPRSKRWSRSRPSPISRRATPRSASITRDRSRRRRSRSTLPRAARSARPRPRSTTRSSASACPRPSAAPSPAPPRPISNRSRACRFCSAPRSSRSISCSGFSTRA